MKRVVLPPAPMAVKRSIDMLGALFGLIILSPFFFVIILLIKFYAPGQAFFRQQRVGRNGKPFRIFKFRTMHLDAEQRLHEDPALYQEYVANGFKLPADRDPRITPIGAFLRKTSLDELPQLINVLLGEMSLVGPRPLVPDEVKIYGDRQEHLLAVRPGMTGYWQVSGRSNVPYPERCELELYYVYNWSLWFDIKILAMTIPSVLRGVGAH